MAGKLPELEVVKDLTEWEWDEFNRLTDKRDLTDEEMSRWMALETKATKLFSFASKRKESEWKEFQALCGKRPDLTKDEFARLIALEDRISAVEAYERLKEEFDLRKRGLVAKGAFGFAGAFIAVLFVQLMIMGYDSQRLRDKEMALQAKLAVLFPGTEPDCLVWPRERLPVIGITTRFEYSCRFHEGNTPEGIDFIRIEGSEAVAYRSVTVTETTERAVDSVEVKRFAIELP